MSNDNSQNDNGDSAGGMNDLDHQAPAVREKKTGIILLTLITLILALAALIFAYHDYRLLQELRTEIPSPESLDRYDRELQRFDQELASVRSNLQAMQDNIEELITAQQRNYDSLQALYDEIREGETEWSIAEIEHLIEIANHRLVLEKDVATALVALQAADQRLATMPDPGLYVVRNRLASEMNSLRSISPVDITGLSIYLADLVTRIQSLPIKQSVINQAGNQTITIDETLPAWKRLSLGIWYEIKSLFVITRTGETVSATLLPDEKYFLYQNLRLQLETARFAVLRRDTGNLRQSLDLIESWLNQYFDSQDNSVMNILLWIERTRNIELDPELPDISSSLRALRAFIERSSGADGN